MAGYLPASATAEQTALFRFMAAPPGLWQALTPAKPLSYSDFAVVMEAWRRYAMEQDDFECCVAGCARTNTTWARIIEPCDRYLYWLRLGGIVVGEEE